MSEQTALNTDTTPTARELLVRWANEQEGWVRILVGEVLQTPGPVADAVTARAFEQYLREKGLADEKAGQIPELVYQSSQEDEAGGLELTELHDVQGVNALANGQKIEFNPRLTVLFGENASGKTGYARVLKAMAAVRTAEDVLPDVHATGAPASQQAVVDYTMGGDKKQASWSGERGVPPFPHMCIFDTAAVALHVDEELTYVYTPADLKLFSVAIEALEAVKALLDEEVGRRSPRANPFLTHFAKGTTVYPVIETLGATTEQAQLDALAEVPADAGDRVQLLRDRVQALSSTAADAQLSVARARASFYESVATGTRTVGEFDHESYNGTIREAETAENEVQKLRAELAKAVGIEEDAAANWEAFVVDGEGLQKHLEHEKYPAEGAPCLYCQQPLGPDAVALLERYRAFATDTARQLAAQARERGRTISAPLRGLDARRLRDDYTARKENDGPDEYLDGLDEFIAGLEQAGHRLNETEKLDMGKLAPAAKAAADEARSRADAAEQTVKELSAEAAKRAESLKTARAELGELEAKVELATRRSEVDAYVADAKWVARAKEFLRRWQPLQKSLTDVAKEASEQLLNADFEQRFQEECEALNAPTVQVAFPGRRGQAARRKLIDDHHRLSQILSEGEQKVLALADFLAEASIRSSPAPVIFDDPVNSLDWRRIHEVAARIAKLSTERQVVVFTHDIWLAALLIQLFEKQKDDCTFYDVSSDPVIGTVRKGTVPRWDSPKKIAGRIKSLIQSAESSEDTTRDALVRQGYSELRAWCETAVEQEFLKGITQRYQPHVRMSALSEIKWERLKTVAAKIEAVFDKACRATEAHSQPFVTQAVRPRLEDLKADWKEAQDAFAEYQAKEEA